MWRCVSLSSYSQMTYQRWLQVECCQKFKLKLSKMTRKDQDSIKHPDSLLKGKWQVFKSIKVVYFSRVVWEDFYDIGTGIDNYFNLQVEWFDYCCNRYSFSILRTIFANVVDNKIDPSLRRQSFFTRDHNWAAKYLRWKTLLSSFLFKKLKKDVWRLFKNI